MAKPSLTNIILFYNKTIGRKELFYKKCNIWLISLEHFIYNINKPIDKKTKKCYHINQFQREVLYYEIKKYFINIFNSINNIIRS